MISRKSTQPRPHAFESPRGPFPNAEACLPRAVRHQYFMPDFAAVRIHESQFPQRVRNALAQSLRTGEINHKFHYDSVKQTQKWLALHQRYAPSRNDPDCIDNYARAFTAASKLIRDESVTLIGL